MLLVQVLEGIISSAPEAIELFRKLAPLLSSGGRVSSEIEAIVPAAHDAVQVLHDALNVIMATHDNKPIAPVALPKSTFMST